MQERNSILLWSHHISNLLLCRLLEIPSSHSVPHIHIYFYQLQNLSEGCSQLVGLDQICWKRESFWPANSECLDRICLLYEVSAYFLIFSIYNCILGIYKQTNMLVLTAKKILCSLFTSLNNFADKTETDNPNRNHEMPQPWKGTFSFPVALVARAVTNKHCNYPEHSSSVPGEAVELYFSLCLLRISQYYF